MLKKVLTALFFILFAIGVHAQQKTDVAMNDSAVVRLDNYLKNYLLITPSHPDSLIRASDYLISLSKDSLVSSHIASFLFYHFYSSDIMGMEKVAIHIATEYFLNGRVKMPATMEETQLRVYVEFNKNSLIGMKAPELNIYAPDDAPVSLMSVNSQYTILFFFDDNCNVCKSMLPGLIKLSDSLASKGVSVFAVYTQSQKNNFQNFIESEFTSKGLGKNWIFAWDPGFDSDFPRLYNVIRTPQIFLLDKDKTIIGRNLDSDALRQLLGLELERDKESLNRVNSFLESYLSGVDLSDTNAIRNEIDPLFEKVSAQKELYSSIFMNLFYKMLYSENDTITQAAVFVAKRYIIPYPALWWDKSYPLEWVPKMVERVQNNKPGSIAGNLTLFDKRGRPVELNSIKSGYTVLYFMNPDCSICKPFSVELKKISRLLKKRGATIVAVNSGGKSKAFFEYNKKNKFTWLSLSPKDDTFYEIFDKFEAESVPMVYLLDNERRIIAKRINTITLEKLVR